MRPDRLATLIRYPRNPLQANGPIGSALIGGLWLWSLESESVMHSIGSNTRGLLSPSGESRRPMPRKVWSWRLTRVERASVPAEPEAAGSLRGMPWAR
jgi:hypothetical protein